MKLYNLSAGLNPRRVRIFLAEKGVDIPLVEVDMTKGENAAPEYLAKNPMGKMPVLELDDGTCISESTAICRYIEALHPEPNLFGRDTLESAQIEMWDRRMELDVTFPVMHAFQHGNPFWEGRLTQVKDYSEVASDTVRKNMAWLDKELEARDYIAAGRYTVADITLQCSLITAKAIGLRFDEHANLTDWFGRVTSRPSARA